jgi:hypothetical protein
LFPFQKRRSLRPMDACLPFAFGSWYDFSHLFLCVCVCVFFLTLSSDWNVLHS